jgi:hypothetical protein
MPTVERAKPKKKGKMPLVRISLRAGAAPEYRKAIADAVHQAMIDAMAIPPKDRFRVISEFKAGELIYDPDYLEVKRSDKIVFVQITLSTGRTPGQKRALFSRMAELLAKSHRAPAGGPACEFSRGELGEWGSSIPEGLVRKTTRATNEPPSLQIRVTGTNRLQVQSGQDQIWPMPPSTCSSTPVM